MKKIFKRTKSDVAAATLVTGIISFVFLCLCLGTALDVAKNTYLKDAQQSKSQESVQAAIKTVDSKGSLANFTADPTGNIPDAVFKVVSEYNNENSSSYNNSLVGEGAHADETTAYKSDSCSVRDIQKYGNTVKTPTKMPYMVIRLDQQRGMGNSASSVVYTVEGNGAPKHVAGSFQPGANYRVVSAEINDSSTNLMLSMFGRSCQDYQSLVSAISFGSQEDLPNN